MTKLIKITIFGFLISVSVGTLYAQNNQLIFKQIECSIQSNKNKYEDLILDVADTEQKRSHGLMNRKDIKSNSGMLFIWNDRQTRNFWMKNTYFNLDLFFLNNQGEIIEIYKNARAFDETNIKSQKKANFVVELKSRKYPLLLGDKFNCPFGLLLK